MVKGSIVTFDGEVTSTSDVMTLLQYGFNIPIKGKTVCTVAWIGESAWRGNKRDMRLCVQLEEYGELMFPLSEWKEATEEEKIHGYFAEYEVISTELHKID